MSRHDQKADRERKGRRLEMFGSDNDWTFAIISDLRSAMTFHQRGRRNLLARMVVVDVNRPMLTPKRSGAAFRRGAGVRHQ